METGDKKKKKIPAQEKRGTIFHCWREHESEPPFRGQSSSLSPNVNSTWPLTVRFHF